MDADSQAPDNGATIQAPATPTMPSPPEDPPPWRLAQRMNAALRQVGLAHTTETVRGSSMHLLPCGYKSVHLVTITGCTLVTVTNDLIVIHFGVAPNVFIHGDVIEAVGMRFLTEKRTKGWFALVRTNRGEQQSQGLRSVEF